MYVHMNVVIYSFSCKCQECHTSSFSVLGVAKNGYIYWIILFVEQKLPTSHSNIEVSLKKGSFRKASSKASQCKLNWTTFWCLWAASKFFLNWIKPFEQQFEQLEEWWGVCFQAKNAKNDDFRETNSYCFSAAVMTA